jgi:acyl transferase domain-containing protein/thioesterase domain-containing protein
VNSSSFVSPSGPIEPGCIAIVGLAGHFPAARTAGELWTLLKGDKPANEWLSDEQLRAAGVSDADMADPHYVRASLVLPDMEMFDADFFGFSQRDASVMDPQHRHFLECAWEALEDAGHMPESFDGAVGVFAGCGMQAYLPQNLLSNPVLVKSMGMFLLRHTGNDKDFLTTRLSYLLDLKGPSIAVQTACSTSLVAVHLAAQSLLSGECDMALAGGVSIELPHRRGYHYAEGEILSPDGLCRAFDEQAAGTVFGSGVGVVVLRRLEDAIAQGDQIYAVIRGSAVNNDGAQKAGYLAPSVDGQARAAVEALAVAGVAPASVQYIEAHGTGTPVGDPIEVAALAQAYARSPSPAGGPSAPCGIGSIKTHIGHLDTAAGVAALIKVCLALRHGLIPASLNFSRANHRLNMERTPFQVLSQPMPWPCGAVPRRAAVNALGVGGTNAHVILEESPLPQPAAQSLSDGSPAWNLLTLSARTPAALQALKAKWQAWLAQPADHLPLGFSLADAAYTLQAGRRTFAHRLGVVAQDLAGLQQALDARHTPRLITGQAAASAPPVVWMFPGGGAPYPGAGCDLLTQPAFAQAVKACLDALPLDAPADLHAVMFAGEDDAAAAALLQQPRYGLLALFILEYALARLWQRWGVQPAAVMGHSAGEYAAACLAGVMSLADALSVVLLRAQLFEAVPTGGMLAVDLPEAELQAQIGTLPLDIAAVNAPDACIASGALPALAALEDKLAARGLQTRRLHIDVAAHSRLLDAVLPAFRERMQRVKLNPPGLPFISNLTGTWVAPDELTDPEYWVRHLRQTVRFADGLNTLRELPGAVWLEVGPGQGLCALARHQGEDAARSIWPSCGKAHEPRADMPVMLAAAAGLWTRGLSLDWPALRGDALRSAAARRVSLPTYAFERQRHWVEPGVPGVPAGAATADFAAAPLAALPLAGLLPGVPALQRLPVLADWLSVPRWEPAALKLQTAAAATPEPRWLVFGGDSKLTAEVVLRILNQGGRVALVRPGRQFASHIDGSFTLAPSDAAQHEQLFRSLEQSHAWPHYVLHLWALDAGPGSPSQWDQDAVIPGQALVFDSLRLSARAMQMLDVVQPVRLTVLTAGSQVLPGDTARKPAQALAMGPCRVMAQEMPQISARLVDVQPDELNARTLARRIVAEAMDTSDVDLVAFRGSERLEMQLVQASASVPAGAGASSTPALALPLRQAGVYLITGGLGDIALTLAAYLARTQQARLALVSRRSLPPRSQWPELAISSADPALRLLLARLLALQDAGAEVLTLSADVADPAAMARAVAACRTRFGALHGVFHTAGVLEDGPIHSKGAHSIRRVLAPKAAGAQVLHDLLPPGTLDFLAVFSSTSVYLGGAGQMDYVAANAMADALVAARPDGAVLHWGIWGDSGMAQRAYGAPAERRLPAQGLHLLPSLHPLLGMRVPVAAQAQGACFEAVYRPQDLWVLSEHRVAGQPVLVGTAYIEIAWAALQVLHPGAGLDMRALSFGEAMVFEDAAAREVRIELLAGDATPAAGEGTRYEFRVYSRSRGDAPWQEHARAALSVLQEGLPVLTAEESQPAGDWQAGRMAQAGAVDFGPRWHNLQRVHFEGRSGTAELELAAPFAADLLHYHCHPALADMAATFALQALDAQTLAAQLFVPLSIARVRLQAALPRQLVSRVKASPADGRLLSFDVRLHTPAGRPLASFEGFCLRGVAPQALAAKAPAAARPPTLIASLLAAGIRSADADALFDLIFAGTARDLTVSSIALADIKQALLAARPVLRAALPVAAAGDMPLAGDAGLDPVERAIAAVWRDLLGVDQIDRQDDFFALGGHSLVAVRLFARIRKEFAVDLPLATLFKAPTLAALAALVTQQRPDDKAQAATAPGATLGLPRGVTAWTPLVEIQPSEPGRQPIFCVHGAAGNVLNFKAIADRLGPGQGFYGLQAQGVDGRLPLLPTIEAMAAQYVAAIRTVEPAGPYRLVGYSGGGVIALEMARQLRQSGAEVGLLAMIDTLAPAAARLKISPLKKIWLMRHWSLDFALGWRERRRHTQAGQANHALALQQRARGEPLAPELASALLYSHFVDVQARYEPQPYDGPMLLCRARQGYTPYLNAGPCLGWQAHVQGELRVVEIDGSHVSMLSGPGLTQLVQGLREEMQRADERQGERPGKPAPVRGPGASGFRAWAAGV